MDNDYILSLKHIINMDFKYRVFGIITLSPDGKYVAFEKDFIEIMNIENGQIIRKFGYIDEEEGLQVGHNDIITSAIFSPNGKYIATSSIDRTIRLWDIKNGEVIRILQEENNNNEWRGDQFCSIAFHPNGKYIASGSIGDGNIKLWDVINENHIKTYENQNSQNNYVSFSPDGQYIASGGDDGCILVWDTGNDQLVQNIKIPIETDEYIRTTSIEFSPDGNCIASRDTDGYFRMWNIKNGKLIKNVFIINQPNNYGYENYLKTFSFSQNGKYIVYNLEDVIIFMEIESEQAIHTLKGCKKNDNVLSVVFCQNDKYVASISLGGHLNIWGEKILPQIDIGKNVINEKIVREKIPENVRHAVWRRDDGKCVECGSKENLEFDHIIPFSEGGSNTERNLQLLCEKCNRKKGASI